MIILHPRLNWLMNEIVWVTGLLQHRSEYSHTGHRADEQNPALIEVNNYFRAPFAVQDLVHQWY